MRKTVTILLAAFFLTTVFAGCGRKNEETRSIHNRNYGDSHRQGEEATNVIVLSEKITELTDGLSAVRHTGDYGFDAFLEQGGASSDAGVVSFLLESGITDFGNLLFGGCPFAAGSGGRCGGSTKNRKEYFLCKRLKTKPLMKNGRYTQLVPFMFRTVPLTAPLTGKALSKSAAILPQTTAFSIYAIRSGMIQD